MKLLIADDSAEMRSLLRGLCANVTTETRDCADGRETIQTFHEFKPDWDNQDDLQPLLALISQPTSSNSTHARIQS
jgi:CheY-like chemotaxis protein